MKFKKNVAVLLYNGVELVDMNGPIDVFLHANAYNNSRYQIYTVAAESGVILSEDQAVTITPRYSIQDNDCPEPDIIVIPGIINNEPDPALIEWIRTMGSNPKKIVMSVCIGAFILARTGLFSGKKATTHYLYIKELQAEYPDITVVRNVRFVEDGNIASTGGITSGIDGALHLVKKLDGEIVAQQTADVMVYNRDAPLPPYTLLPPYDSI